MICLICKQPIKRRWGDPDLNEHSDCRAMKDAAEVMEKFRENLQAVLETLRKEGSEG